MSSFQVSITISMTTEQPPDAAQVASLTESLVRSAATVGVPFPVQSAATPHLQPPIPAGQFNPTNDSQVKPFLIQAIGAPNTVERVIFSVWLENEIHTSLDDLVKAADIQGIENAEEKVRLALRHLGKRLKYPGFRQGVAPLPLRLLVHIKSDNDGRRHHKLTPAGREALRQLLDLNPTQG